MVEQLKSPIAVLLVAALVGDSNASEAIGHLYVLRRLPFLLILLVREPPLGAHAPLLGDRSLSAGSLRTTGR